MGYSIAPWSKGGLARLYVNRGDSKVGYFDLGTMAPGEGDAEEVTAAVAEFVETIRVSVLGEEPTQPQSTKPVPGLIDWGVRDLARNIPGASIADEGGTSYQDGIAAEQRTAGILATLPGGYRVVHSVPLSPQKDIDHLIVGPTGVFVVNTKSSTYPVQVTRDSVKVDGYRKTWVESIERDASVATERLSAAVRATVPVSSMVAVWSKSDVQLSPDVAVHLGADIANAITSRPTLLEHWQVDVILAAARRSDTWTAWH